MAGKKQPHFIRARIDVLNQYLRAAQHEAKRLPGSPSESMVMMIWATQHAMKINVPTTSALRNALRGVSNGIAICRPEMLTVEWAAGCEVEGFKPGDSIF